MVRFQLRAHILPLYHKCDSNNDNILDMDEFFKFAHFLYDAADFYHVASRNFDFDAAAAMSDFDSIPKTFGVITQEEWDCTQNPDFTGLDPENCKRDSTQTLVGMTTKCPRYNLGPSETTNIVAND